MAYMRALICVLALSFSQGALLQKAGVSTGTTANPIRKVVTMLQNMQSKVEEEGKKGLELYEKFMCYCKNGVGDLEKTIGDAETKLAELTPAIEEGEAKLKQLKEEVMKHKKDRDAAKASIKEADEIRAKEKAEFDKLTSDQKANIDAIMKAVAALEKGMTGFLQTGVGQRVLNIVKVQQDMPEGDKEDLVAFLQGAQDSSYAPSSGEVVGILKQMGDEMDAALTAAIAAEEKAIAEHAALVAAKKKEVAAATAAIEEKTVRIGDLAVEVETMKVDLGDTADALAKDQEFLTALKTDCATKTAEWEEISKNRADELVALADTIKILNNDDALDLFKKFLPAAGSSFMQLQVTSSMLKAKALVQLQRGRAFALHRPQLDFIMLAIRGKKIGFEKVIQMIDEMVATLKTEQADDDKKKEYCEAQFDETEDKIKVIEHDLADTETSIEDTTESIATVTSEIAAIEEGIKALDKSVAEATELRKEEHADFVELITGDSAAKEILEFAKNRLQKFYNPKLYIAPVNATVESLVQVAPAEPPPAPEAYTKSQSSGVIHMIDVIIKDLDKELQESKTEEKLAQEDYEKTMADCAAKRATDSKLLTEKEGNKAELQSSLEDLEKAKAAGAKELTATKEYLSSLHAECDWLIQYFGVRKEARAGEIDSLEKAKAVLSGADYSLVQTHSHRFLKAA